MDKKEAKEVLDKLNDVGRKCGYRDVMVNAHFLADLERFLNTFSGLNPKSNSACTIETFKLILEALAVDVDGFEGAKEEPVEPTPPPVEGRWLRNMRD